MDNISSNKNDIKLINIKKKPPLPENINLIERRSEQFIGVDSELLISLLLFLIFVINLWNIF